MNQNTKSTLDLLNSIATVALWMAIPAGIALGMSIKAFEAVFPSWFFPSGCLLQVALYVAMLVFVDKRVPRESMQARIGSLLMFFIPLPLYIMTIGTDVEWSNLQRYSPFVAWAIPVLMIGLMSLTAASSKRKG